MITPSHPKNCCFMQDFASLDARSAHAHLRGRSRRAQAYVLFDGISCLVGRRDHAASDYRHLIRWLFIHRQPLKRGAQALLSTGTAVSGMGRYRALSDDAGLGAASRPGNDQSAGGTSRR